MNSATFAAQNGNLANMTTSIKWKTRRKITANKSCKTRWKIMAKNIWKTCLEIMANKSDSCVIRVGGETKRSTNR